MSGDADGLVELDGSEGEGGGQILRTALSLSLITGRPFRIRSIRARRSQPGLRPQHLACVRGAEAISEGSKAEGAQLGSSELSFIPGKVKPGDYLLEVGTAGSTPLLLQCLLFPLALAGGGKLALRGGTHVPHSPTFHYLSWAWLPVIGAYGLRTELSLRHAGFYPEGAGELIARIHPSAEPPQLVELASRGTLRDVHVTSMVGGLSFDVAERQAKAAALALRERGVLAEVEKRALPVTRSAGSVVLVRAEFERTLAGFTALGERNDAPEERGREAAAAFLEFLSGSGSLDEHLGDQILLPAALLAAKRLGESSPGTTVFRAAKVTSHLSTNASVIQRFLPVTVDISAEAEVSVRASEPGASSSGPAA